MSALRRWTTLTFHFFIINYTSISRTSRIMFFITHHTHTHMTKPLVKMWSAIITFDDVLCSVCWVPRVLNRRATEPNRYTFHTRSECLLLRIEGGGERLYTLRPQVRHPRYARSSLQPNAINMNAGAHKVASFTHMLIIGSLGAWLDTWICWARHDQDAVYMRFTLMSNQQQPQQNQFIYSRRVKDSLVYNSRDQIHIHGHRNIFPQPGQHLLLLDRKFQHSPNEMTVRRLINPEVCIYIKLRVHHRREKNLCATYRVQMRNFKRFVRKPEVNGTTPYTGSRTLYWSYLLAWIEGYNIKQWKSVT